MPDKPKLPPLDAIGSHGEFTGKMEVIYHEQRDRRTYIDAETGETIATFLAADHNQSPPPVAMSPQITSEKVMEFDVRRFGIKHSDVDLRALRQLVEMVGADKPEGLRIADLNGWSGEIALALCRQFSFDVVTIVDHLYLSGRNLEINDNAGELLIMNLGDLLGSRMQWSVEDPLNLATEIEDEFDIVFVDSAATPDRLAALLNAWVYHLTPGGCIVGSFQTDERLAVVKAVFDGVPLRSFGDSLWLVTSADLFPEDEGATAADEPAEAVTGD